MIDLLLQACRRVRAFFQPKPLDLELDAEVASHLELAVEENIQRGMPPEAARRRALVDFGGAQQGKERQRVARGLPWLDVLLQDLRFTLRTLRRDRTFAIVAVLILALGIGANILVFSVVNTLLLRPLPFPQAGELVRIVPKPSKCGASCATYSTDAVQEFQRRNQSFSDVTGYDAFTSPGNWKLTTGAIPQTLSQIDVMENFFKTLGVQPLMGRDVFTTLESSPNGPPVVILSYAYWKGRLNGDPNILGRAISFNNTPVTVIGVLPEGFDFGSIYSPGTQMDVFTPDIYDNVREEGNMLSLTGRLRPGITLAQAQAEANLLFPNLDGSVKRGYKGNYNAQLWDLKTFISGSLRRSLIVLWCAVGFILLIVCVNLSNLLLARAAVRAREFAMRTALGAGRARIVRQLFTESLVLSAAGAALGLLLAVAGVFYLAHQTSFALPLLSSIRIDNASLSWTFFVAILAALLFGIAPGLRISRMNLQEALKDSGHGTSAGRKHDRLRSTLAVTEIALACVLLVAAGLLFRSFLHVLDVDLGFNPSQASTIQLSHDDQGKTANMVTYDREVIRQIEAIPGVQSAAMTDSLPMSRNRSWGVSMVPKSTTDSDYHDAFVYIVTPGYVHTAGMRFLSGRDFSWEDNRKDESVVILNHTLAHTLFGDRDPINQMIPSLGARVIGVLEDVRETSAESAGGAQMYLSAGASQWGSEDQKLVIRSTLPAATLQPTVLATLRRIDAGQPSADLTPMQLLVDHATSPRRFFVYLVGFFAALGLLLAALGIYGVIAYSVTQRTQEIGIRMALGATRADVQMGIVRQALRLASVGISLGAIASLAASSRISSLLFDTSPYDPLTFVAIALLLVLVAIFAGYLPARHASRINPMVALRNA
ncbi:MAG: ABC transporter permease [Acidobacteriaceae bacterium]